MHFQLFQYPLPAPAELTDLNAWLRSHRVVAVQQHVVPTGGGAMLLFIVQSVEAAPLPSSVSAGKKVDYREVLTTDQFALFSRLREERKKIADAEGVPVYAVFTNEQLAEMTKLPAPNLSALSSIEGLGKARLEKHGPAMLALLVTNH